jgi:hypothetical protein
MKLPLVDPVHDSVDVPTGAALVRVTLVGARVHVRPVDGETVGGDNVTVPLKPSSASTVTVEVPAALTATLTLLGLADMEKSGAELTV